MKPRSELLSAPFITAVFAVVLLGMATRYAIGGLFLLDSKTGNYMPTLVVGIVAFVAMSLLGRNVAVRAIEIRERRRAGLSRLPYPGLRMVLLIGAIYLMTACLTVVAIEVLSPAAASQRVDIAHKILASPPWKPTLL